LIIGNDGRQFVNCQGGISFVDLRPQVGDGPFDPALDDWLLSEAQVRRVEDAAIDEASEESLPASDAPAY
jgi:hypothetical protein